MLTIRLTRKGKKNQPFFRVVVIDKRRTASGGRAVEDLGYVDPLTKKRNFKKDRILYWISKGAKPSATIHNYLVSEKIIDAKKIKLTNISKKKSAEIAAASASAKAIADKPVAAPVEAKPAEEAKPAA
ncbi:MAG: 30S ribosomal protein S16 [Candidatus Staskawiczbacteria bacterium]|nr:30S ribosomal protein S16 [Candidatus Staskawiczbacteria bacterium]